MSPIQRPTRDDVVIFASADEARAWFEANHDSAREVFIGFYRKGVPKTAATYAETVLEALCVGWIDGITFGIDDELRAARFTPRRRTSNWSRLNIARVAELTAAGRMRPVGLRAFEERDARNDLTYSYERPPLELPVEWLSRLEADPAAGERWQVETKTFRSQASYWVMSAKRQETRDRRFAELLASLAAGRRPRQWPVTRGRPQQGER
jgi:uncharacterized protein YdeI (YjbR/CyaY-like superfamily)